MCSSELWLMVGMRVGDCVCRFRVLCIGYRVSWSPVRQHDITGYNFSPRSAAARAKRDLISTQLKRFLPRTFSSHATDVLILNLLGYCFFFVCYDCFDEFNDS